MGKGYTELFFLDEVTALAAGHRPCFECRRDDAKAFAHAFNAGIETRDPGIGTLSADDIDRRLHLERVDGKQQRTFQARLADLPPATMAKVRDQLVAVHANGLLLWTPAGYRDGGHLSAATEEVQVLTPRSTTDALTAGYRPLWHMSASDVHPHL